MTQPVSTQFTWTSTRVSRPQACKYHRRQGQAKAKAKHRHRHRHRHRHQHQHYVAQTPAVSLTKI